MNDRVDVEDCSRERLCGATGRAGGIVTTSEVELLEDEDPEPGTAADWLLPTRGYNDLPQVAWRTGDLIVALMFVILWRAVVWVIQQDRALLSPTVVFVIGGVIPFLLIAWLPVWAYVRGGGGWPVKWPSLTRWMLEFTFALPVMIGLYIAIAVLSVVWTSQVGESPMMDERIHHVAFSNNPWLLAVMALGAGLWAPLSEELFFRGLLQNALSQRMSVFVASVVQTMLFAGMHTYTGVHFAAVTVVGAGLTLHYLWRKTLIATMCLHAQFNVLMLTLVGAVMLLASRAPVMGVVLEQDPGVCRIAAVSPQSGAEQGGLLPGDVIQAFDGEAISNSQMLQMALLGREAGEDVIVRVDRAGESVELTIRLMPRSSIDTPTPEATDGSR